MKESFIKEVKAQAENNWRYILKSLDITVSDNPKKHTPCPNCGGKDRFRFDDQEGRGTYICNQCGSGDGFNLIALVKHCTIKEAATLASQILNPGEKKPDTTETKTRDNRASQTIKQINNTAPTRHNKTQPARPQPAPPQSARPQQAPANSNRAIFLERYQKEIALASQQPSPYLAGKKIDTADLYPVKNDGTTIITLYNEQGEITAAGLIRASKSPSLPDKQLIKGSQVSGSFHIISHGKAPQQPPPAVIIAEGLATAYSALAMAPQKGTLAAMAVNAGNLTHVAQAIRRLYPDTQIIIAADNDIRAPGETAPNTGKAAAEKAALASAAAVTLPPSKDKADWNDWHQSHPASAAQDFTAGIYQPMPAPAPRRNPVWKDANSASARGEILIEHYQPENIATDTTAAEIYLYKSGIWQRTESKELERTLADILKQRGETYSHKGIESAVKTAMLTVQKLGQPGENCVSFRQGIIDLASGQFIAHQRHHWQTTHNGIDYTAPQPGETLKTHAPHFWQWSNYARSGHPETLYAMLFAALTNRTEYIIELTGRGGTGKSLTTEIATILAGEPNTVSSSIKSLDSPEGREAIIGKKLIILPDQEKYIGDASILKSITGGDALLINQKYKTRFSTRIKALIIATNNDPMIFTERNGGIDRRMIRFVMNREVPADKRDPALIEKIKQEIPVIARYLITNFTWQSARALLEQQAKSAEAKAIARETDHTKDFFSTLETTATITADNMEMGGKNHSHNPHKYVYHAYLAYCDYHNTKNRLAPNHLSRALSNAAKYEGRTLETQRTNSRTKTNLKIPDERPYYFPAALYAELLTTDLHSAKNNQCYKMLAVP